MPEVLAAPTDSIDTPHAFVRPTRPALPVIEGGVATTVLTLAGLYWLAHTDSDFNPMGLYADYVLPVGAVLVGLVAGSGYGFMSWLKGVKIRRGLLVTVVAIQLFAYGAAEYMAYLDIVHRATVDAERDGKEFIPLPFFEYFHYKTENFAWKADHGDKAGEPLGDAGYFFVVLAALGFVGGGLLTPLIALGVPYCEGCQRYMKTKQLGVIAASVPFRKISKKDTAGREVYHQDLDAAAAVAETHVTNLAALALAGDAAGFNTAAATAFGPRKATHKLHKRVATELIYCPGCQRGWVKHTALVGQGKQLKRYPLGKTEITAEFAKSVLPAKA